MSLRGCARNTIYLGERHFRRISRRIRGDDRNHVVAINHDVSHGDGGEGWRSSVMLVVTCNLVYR